MTGIHPLEIYRRRREMTRAALARELSVSKTTVARWELGLRRVDLEIAPRISEITGIPVRELRPDVAQLVGAA